MTIEITNERLNNFVLAGKRYTEQTPVSILWFVVDRMVKKFTKDLKKVEKERIKITRKYALKKEKGLFDLDDKGNLQFPADKQDELENEIEALFDKKIEVETDIVPAEDFDEKALSHDMRNVFEGIVIPSIDHDAKISALKNSNHKELKLVE